MASVETTIHLGEIFLETADGTKISLGQLKAPFNITIEPPKPTQIQIGSTVKISDDPKSLELGDRKDGWVDPDFRGKVGKVNSGLSDTGNWGVRYGGSFQWIAPEHLTVVS